MEQHSFQQPRTSVLATFGNADKLTMFGGLLTETTTRGWDSDIMLEYVLVITSTQKHGCPSKGTPWALCTQPRPAVWGYFTPVLLIIHTSGPPYFHMHIDMTDCFGVDFSVTYGPWVWTYGC